MILSWLILALSLAMVFFYFQATCQRILRRQFDREYFRSIANVIRLEFPSLRKSLEEFGAPVDYSRLPKALKCDFLALTHLLRNTADVKPGYSKEQRLLILYFRCAVAFLGSAAITEGGREKSSPETDFSPSVLCQCNWPACEHRGVWQLNYRRSPLLEFVNTVMKKCRLQAAARLMGGDKGMQPALHSMSRHRHRTLTTT